MGKTKVPNPMINVDPAARVLNSARMAISSRWERLEHNRHTDLPLVLMCMRPSPPEHVTKVSEGAFSVDLPAGVYKIVWIVPDGFGVATYLNHADRDDDL